MSSLSSFDLFLGAILLAATGYFLADVLGRGISRRERIRAAMNALWAFSWSQYAVHYSRASTLAMWLLVAITLATVIVNIHMSPTRGPPNFRRQ